MIIHFDFYGIHPKGEVKLQMTAPYNKLYPECHVEGRGQNYK